jgi:hypothetical protein
LTGFATVTCGGRGSAPAARGLLSQPVNADTLSSYATGTHTVLNKLDARIGIPERPRLVHRSDMVADP